LTLPLTLVYLSTRLPTSATTVLYVDPKAIKGTVGQNFIININILNVTDLYGWQFKLRWDSTILDVVNVTEGNFLKHGGSTFFWPKINNTAGYFSVYCTLMGNIPGVNGSGALATIQFHVRGSGKCDLLLYGTILVSSSEKSIAYTVKSGKFST
jgi:hypothetical protein